METSLPGKILNTRDALLLYELIGRFVPEVDEEMHILSFISQIVDALVDAGEHQRYIDAIVLMTDVSQDELVSKPIEQVVVLFAEGLMRNHILLLCKFCKELGYGRT